MSGWKPIDSAPKDGSEILVSDATVKGGNMVVVFYDYDEGKSPYVWQTSDGISYHAEAFTHWQILPNPPVEILKAKQNGASA